MGNVVLLEGLDKTGKTTLAGALAARLGAGDPVHFMAPKPGDDVRAQYHAALDRAAEWDGWTVIDRMHHSEEAYSSVFRVGESALTAHDLEELDKRIADMDGAIILCTRPVKEIFHALDEADHKVKKAKHRVTLTDLERLAFRFRIRLALSRIAGTSTFKVPLGLIHPDDLVAVLTKEKSK